jgi:hypothetical protein
MRFAQAFADAELPHQERDYLRAACELLIVQFFDDIRDVDRERWSLEKTAMLAFLPARYRPRFTPDDAIDFYICLVSVVGKLGQQQWQFPACLAEELALRALLEVARAQAASHEHNVDYGKFADDAFRDHDFEYLFRPEEDGIEESEVGEFLRMGSLSLND